MSKNKLIKFDPAIRAQFTKWFGPPQVLTDEDRQIHAIILCGLVHDFGPRDFIERMHIDDLTHNLCQRLALRRRKNNVIRRAHNEKFERQKRELLQDAERRKQEPRSAEVPRPTTNGTCDRTGKDGGREE